MPCEGRLLCRVAVLCSEGSYRGGNLYWYRRAEASSGGGSERPCRLLITQSYGAIDRGLKCAICSGTDGQTRVEE